MDLAHRRPAARRRVLLALAVAALTATALPTAAPAAAQEPSTSPTVVGVAVGEAGPLPLPLPPPAGQDVPVTLFTFPADDPTDVQEVEVTGLDAGEVVLGIDRRPATGDLLGVTSASRLVVLDPATGEATPVGEPFEPALPEGTAAVGFDVNPVVDKVRLVAGTTNLRLDPATGQVAAEDADLAYAADDGGAGSAPVAAAAGYTGSQAGPPSADRATRLVVVDAERDVLALQDPPNEGVLRTVGPLGLDVGEDVHLDITGTDEGYLLAGTTFARLDVASGAASEVGEVAVDGTVTGLAVELDRGAPPAPQPGPGAAATTAVAVTTAGRLQVIELGEDAVSAVGPARPLTGLAAGERVTAIDHRLVDGTLLAVTDAPALYAVDVDDASATRIGPPAQMPLDVVVESLDVNPTVDLLRYQGASGANRRVDPDSGGVRAVDGDLRYADGDPGAGAEPAVTGSAYANNLAGATTTTLYVVDSDADVLARQDANAGVLTTIGDLGVDLGPGNGFDVGQDGVAYLAGAVDDGLARVARVDLATGAATTVGDLDLGAGGGTVPGEGIAAFAVVPEVGRLFGTDRFATSAQVSRRTVAAPAPVAFVASGASFADALAGGPPAAEAGAPILLVAADRIPDPVRAELQRLQPEEVVVLGGPAAVGPAVESELRDLAGAGGVRRLSGADRYATAAAIATDAYEPGVPVLHVATGEGFADALAGGAAAAAADGPLLLTARDRLPEATADAVEALAPERVVVLGGAAAVSDAVLEQLRDLVDGEVDRLSGADRFATAAAVARAAFPTGADVAVVTTGRDFPDALTAVPTTGARPGPVLLVEPAVIPSATSAVLADLPFGYVRVVGGRVAVSEDVERALAVRPRPGT